MKLISIIIIWIKFLFLCPALLLNTLYNVCYKRHIFYDFMNSGDFESFCEQSGIFKKVKGNTRLNSNIIHISAIFWLSIITLIKITH